MKSYLEINNDIQKRVKTRHSKPAKENAIHTKQIQPDQLKMKVNSLIMFQKVENVQKSLENIFLDFYQKTEN